jgi:serine-type D-Ala-D-Ala carboxypeptidase/endopeptidase (penicillin-binding protein 4)
VPEPGDNRWPLVDDDDFPVDVPPAPPTDDQPVAGTLDVEPAPPEPAPTRQLPVPPEPSPTVLIAAPVPVQPPAEPTMQLEWPPREPPRAAPARIGPEPPPPMAPPLPQKKRGKKVALIVVAMLILVAGTGTGAVFLVPGLKAKLGLGKSEPAVVIAPPPAPVQFAPALRPPGTEAPAPTAAGLAAALSGPVSAPGLGTLTGTVLDPTTGAALWEQGAGTPLVPASTGKLLAAAAALLSVSHTEQLRTKVVAGKDPGTVIIVGGGDPTLSSLKAGADSVYPGAAHVSDLVDQVKAHGGAKTVYVDVSRYAGNAMEASWDAADVPGGHIAPIMPVMLDGGRADATKATTPRSATPAKAMAEEFANRIGAKLAPEVTATAPQGAAVLGEVLSAPMVELVDTLLQRSDNVLAEAVAHEVARTAGEEVSFAGASRATMKVLQQNGFDITGLSMADASGLSGQDKVPAKLLASILAVAAGPDGKDPRTAKLRPLLGGLPVAGGSGTLADRYNTGGATIGRGWVRAKTGTLSVPPVNSLAGIVLDNDGRLLVFALMTNGSSAATARPALDTIAATLRKCGCK